MWTFFIAPGLVSKPSPYSGSRPEEMTGRLIPAIKQWLGQDDWPASKRFQAKWIPVRVKKTR
jgi:hypothetical protein